MATASGLILSDSTGKQGKLYTTQTVLRAGENTPDYIKPGVKVELDMNTFPSTRLPAKNDIGPDGKVIVPPLYDDENGDEFMIMSIRNLLYVIDEDDSEVEEVEVKREVKSTIVKA
jgi:hypothetical protein